MFRASKEPPKFWSGRQSPAALPVPNSAGAVGQLAVLPRWAQRYKPWLREFSSHGTLKKKDWEDSMRHKYQSLIEELPNCPPTSCDARDVTAFRFVFLDLADTKNYLPPCVINPDRRNSPTDGARICDGYGLSFFDSLEHSTAFYRQLRSSFKKIHVRLGTHVSQANLVKSFYVMGIFLHTAVWKIIRLWGLF